MGLFSRGNSSASSRKNSHIRLPFDSVNENEGLQNRSGRGPPANVLDLWPHAATKGPVDPPSTASEMHGRADLGAPALPVRISSNDDAIMNGLAQTLVRRGRKLKISAIKMSLVSNFSISTIRSHASKDSNHFIRTFEHTEKPDGLDLSTTNISNPSHFQHLAHALPQHFAKMVSASHSDLVADFSAMRASQNARRDFRGIRTVDVHSRTSSVESNTASLTRSEASSSQSSAVLSFGSDSSRNSLQNYERSLHSRTNEICVIRSKESSSQPSLLGSSKASLAPSPKKSPRRVASQYEEEAYTCPGQDISSLYCGSTSPFKVEEDSKIRSDLIDAAHESAQKAAAKLVEMRNVSLPCEAHYPEEDWPLCPYEGILPSTSIVSIRGRSLDAFSHSECSSPDSAGSSSQESSATLTSRSLTKSSSKETVLYSTLASLSTPKQQKTMQRSSLNNGLFTSWSFEDEPPQN